MKADALPIPPRGPLSPKQQSEAIRRVTAQAQQRVQLGMQLFKAAEAYTTQQQDLLGQIKDQQDHLRDQIQKDVASTLQTYDQWMARFDQNFTRSLTKLETKIDTLQRQWEASQLQIATLTRRAETLLDQSRVLLQSVAHKAPTAATPATTEPTKISTEKSPAQPAKNATKQPPAQPQAPQSNAIYRKAVEHLRDGAADDLLSDDEPS